jgi:hypothetical protein
LFPTIVYRSAKDGKMAAMMVGFHPGIVRVVWSNRGEEGERWQRLYKNNSV